MRFSSLFSRWKTLRFFFSGYMENTKLEYEQKQKRAVSVETVGNDPKVKDYSFFFDPNEPTGNSTKRKFT